MSARFALSGARIFDGEEWHEDKALLVGPDGVEAIKPVEELAGPVEIHKLDGGMLVPGFIDLQVNGGGGLLLNSDPSVETIRTICAAHIPFGTTALLPTLITDTPEVVEAAIAAGKEAQRRKMPGFLGLHLEGPHLSLAKKGAHDPALIRPMEDRDLERLIAARRDLTVLTITVAPETVTPEQIAALAGAGVVVSIGHSNAEYDTVFAAIAAGARQVTHLFNAMSPLQHRDPGVVGAALDSGEVYAGLIADGYHVNPHAMAIALRAKRRPGRIFLVTDAMATIGTDMREFTLKGRLIRREGGRLTLEDGTLAGADLDMISAVRFIHRQIGLELGEALRMASLYPAEAVGQDKRLGRLREGTAASFVHLSKDLDVRSVWIDGTKAYASPSAPG
ncbi:N-acetylglucosamine-6-phosphate deacetylase [Mesorhizobium sp. J18]|uniref:N-acetylglucosamine-6-phosphate deacetylase n=1 Tax=Mesorhizobium sp. J18 TaxID=935263 RepID=UPI00119A9DE4|nr:N-acetylglucosamine-6-phosphate deacetylase [Mesorhizobium sp. J18]TWH00117.1 N-acetylglucosamine-6-phosphate deacetylase [Mesorhizobium sp. J18]